MKREIFTVYLRMRDFLVYIDFMISKKLKKLKKKLKVILKYLLLLNYYPYNFICCKKILTIY